MPSGTASKKPAYEHKGFMEETFVCNTRVMGLDPGESREERFLKKIIRVDEAGWELEADPKVFKLHQR